ncbi:MAG: hypothetical protein K2Q15_05515 [Burkholderiales bacterium]|nr:hypothetical protein [Burkholderiales bacterium]
MKSIAQYFSALKQFKLAAPLFLLAILAINAPLLPSELGISPELAEIK